MTVGAVTTEFGRMLFQASTDAVLLCQADGVIVAANPAACRLFEMTEVELRDGGFRMVTAPSYHGQLPDALLKGATRKDLSFVRKGGRSFIGEVTVGGGDGGDAVLIIRERALRHLLGGAEGVLRSLTHELGSPIAAIRNILYLLRHGADTTITHRAYCVIERHIEAVGAATENVADVIRIIRGTLELHKRPLNVARVVQEVAQECSVALEARGVFFRAIVPPGEAMILGDPERIEQVVRNLIVLAAKRSTRKSTIVADVAVAGEEVTIRVRSTAGDIDGILRSETTGFLPDDDPPGDLAGALVRGLTELHGGTIEAMATGEASLLVATFPLLKRAVCLDSTVEPGAGRKEVVVVDDDPDVADTLAVILKRWGHEVTVAYDGPSAVAAVEMKPPQIVLCDLTLPGMDGHQVAKTIRVRKGEEVIMVAISGRCDAEEIFRAHAAGFHRYLTKPVNLMELRRLIDSVPLASTVTNDNAG